MITNRILKVLDNQLFITFILIIFPVNIIADPVNDTRKGMEAFSQSDVITAMQLFRKAANEGYAPAQAKLAYLLDQSELNVEAIEWYTKSAEQGNPEGQYGLGKMYLKGEGTEKNPDLAIKWITAAAEQELVDAMNTLATIYEDGLIENNIDYEQAVLWHEMAANLGDQRSIVKLANAYRNGELGLPIDESKSMFWENKLQSP